MDSGGEFRLPIASDAAHPREGKGKQSKPSNADGARVYIGAQEQQSMRAFAEVIRAVLERDESGAQGRGAKRKMEWEA